MGRFISKAQHTIKAEYKMVNSLSTERPPKPLIFRWVTLKGLTAILLFLLLAVVIEYFVVLYAVNLGVKDEKTLQWNLQFPNADRVITIQISPLFHLVPIAVVIALVSSWTYLSRHVAVKPYRSMKRSLQPTGKQRKEQPLKDVKKLAAKIRKPFQILKSKLLKIRGIEYIWRKIHFARATIKSALTVLMIFGTFILLGSLLTYPQLIYWTVSNAYQNNPLLLDSVKSITNFGKSIAEVLMPIGWICTSLNNALISIAPGFRDFTEGLGNLIKPLVELDGVGKYLVFQNIGTWISALTALLYAEYRRKSYRSKTGRR